VPTSTTTTTTPTPGGASTTTTTIPASVNGCTLGSAQDRTGQAQVSVPFGGGLGFAYSPACLLVSTGTQVTFQGTFSSHPLAGGTVNGSTEMPDAGSPFMPVTSTGPSKAFTLPVAGDYGFYCDNHGAIGMRGAVFVR
jgi:plastocyanin